MSDILITIDAALVDNTEAQGDFGAGPFPHPLNYTPTEAELAEAAKSREFKAERGWQSVCHSTPAEFFLPLDERQYPIAKAKRGGEFSASAALYMVDDYGDMARSIVHRWVHGHLSLDDWSLVDGWRYCARVRRQLERDWPAKLEELTELVEAARARIDAGEGGWFPCPPKITY